jgi:hypothetical protein
VTGRWCPVNHNTGQLWCMELFSILHGSSDAMFRHGEDVPDLMYSFPTMSHNNNADLLNVAAPASGHN